jgi:predicted RNA binding protein YcfA (HicA-like mRNA interferase family)
MGIRWAKVLASAWRREDGWNLVATRGSHRQFKHPSKPGHVTVAGQPGEDLRQVR